jgi:hypothetical protein
LTMQAKIETRSAGCIPVRAPVAHWMSGAPNESRVAVAARQAFNGESDLVRGPKGTLT